jgi:hypothetical protein
VYPSNTDVTYNVITANNGNMEWETTASWKETFSSARVTLSGYRVFAADPVNVGERRYGLTVNGVDEPPGAPTVTLSGGQQINTGTGEITLTPSDLFAVMSTPSGTPSPIGNGLSWAFVGSVPPPECPGETGPSRTDGLPYVPPDFPACAGSGVLGPPRTGA